MTGSPNAPATKSGFARWLLRTRHAVVGRISARPRLILPMLRAHAALTGRGAGAPVVRSGTELVIEGFPRCANTFAVAAFQFAQGRPVRLAHHVHMAAQIMAAARRQTPALVLVREPLAAFRSYLVRCPFFTPAMVLDEYIRFYGALLNYKANFVAATFEQVTSDFGMVIDRINTAFNTDFARFEHTEASVAAVFSRVEASDRDDRDCARVTEMTVARPSMSRDAAADRVGAALDHPKHRPLRDRARELYQAFGLLAKAGEDV